MKRILLGSFMSIFLISSIWAQTKRVSSSPPLAHTGNGNGAISFNVQAGNAPIVIKDIGGIAYVGTFTMEIWYNTSPINTATTGWSVTSGGWTLAGTYTFTGTGPTNRVSYTNSAMNLVIPSNTTYGICLTTNSYPYNTYNASNPTVFTNNNEATIKIGPNIGFGGTKASMGNYVRSFIGYVDYQIQGFNNDAGISGMPYPGIPVCSAFTDSIALAVTNYGFNRLDSCIVHWSINDSLQPSQKFSTTLTPGSTGVSSLKYYKNLASGDTIKAWTTMPNGVPDSLPSNDTLYFVTIEGLNGIYKVGGVSPDYATLDSAILDLNLRGVCGPVTFQLNDTTNKANVSIKKYHGASQSNLVSFVSASGDPRICFITDASTSAANNYSLIFDEGSYIKFKDLSLVNLSSGSYAGVIDIRNGANNLAFENCNISSAHTGSSANAYLVKSGTKGLADHLEFLNCSFEGGSWSVHLQGEKGKVQSFVTFKNNTFKNPNRSAIWLDYIGDINITSNKISSNSTYQGAAAMRVYNTEGFVEIYGNQIMSSQRWPRHGLQISNSTGRSTKRNIVSTNSFSIGDTNSASSDAKIGINVSSVAFFSINSNSISIVSKDKNSSAFKIANSSGNTITNNVFASMGSSGISVDASGLGSILSMDNNLLYSMSDLGKFNGSNQQDLASWQSNTGFDAKSISEDPIFRGVDDLNMCSKNADNIGTGFGLVVDFAGSLRHPMTPDPGAFEYSAISGITVADKRVCFGDTAAFFVAKGVNDVMIWNHTDTSQTFKTTSTGIHTLTALGVCGADTTTFNVINNALVKVGKDTNICGGDTLKVSSSLSNATYKWNNGMTSKDINVTMNGQYIVNAVDSDGCASADTVEITVSQMVILRSDTVVCDGHTVELDPGTPGGNYAWGRNGSPVSTATKIFAGLAGKYSVTYTDAKSCVSSDTFNLTVKRIPSSKFTWTQNQNNVEFTANDTTGTNYHWSFGDGKSVTGPNWITLNKYAANGSFNATLIVTSDLCGDSTTSDVVLLETIGINDLLDSDAISVYPNPSNGIVNVNISDLNTSEKLNLEVVTIDGKVVYQKDDLNTGNIYQLDLTQTVSTGMYVIRVKTDQEIIYTGKISIK